MRYDLALLTAPDAGGAGAADHEPDVREREAGQVPDDAAALADRPSASN